MVEDSKKLDHLKSFFVVLQKKMQSELEYSTSPIGHAPTKGDISEDKWINWLKNYLPKRYKVDKAFIIDSNGDTSEQIDLVIYDNQYTPFIFINEGWKYIPAESVYAVFEIKQNLNKEHLEYASKKIDSVKKLKRTSAPITHVGGVSGPVNPKQIISGILTLSCDWSDGLGDTFIKNIESIKNSKNINIGCALQVGGFEIEYEDKIEFRKSLPENSLIYFFLKLLKKLQKVGTVPALDIDSYLKCLE